MGNPFSSPPTDAGRTEDREESGRWPFASHDDSDRRSTADLYSDASSSASELPVSLVFQTITIMADVGLPSHFVTMPPERGARSRPSFIFTTA